MRSDIEVKGKKVKVTYSVTLGKRFRIGEITYSVPDGEFKDDFLADTSEITVRSGDYLSEDALEKETELRASAMRRKGYFGFTKNYFSFEADTLNSPDTAGLLMTVKEYTRNQTPEYARPHRKYYMGKVTLSYDKDLKFNDKVLRNMCTLHPGDLYDEKEVNTTYSRLSAPEDVQRCQRLNESSGHRNS